jgi:hypothetical protein
MRIHMRNHLRTLGIPAEFICIEKTEAEANALRRAHKKRVGKAATQFLKFTSLAREQGTLPNEITDMRRCGAYTNVNGKRCGSYIFADDRFTGFCGNDSENPAIGGVYHKQYGVSARRPLRLLENRVQAAWPLNRCRIVTYYYARLLAENEPDPTDPARLYVFQNLRFEACNEPISGQGMGQFIQRASANHPANCVRECDVVNQRLVVRTLNHLAAGQYLYISATNEVNQLRLVTEADLSDWSDAETEYANTISDDW